MLVRGFLCACLACTCQGQRVETRNDEPQGSPPLTELEQSLSSGGSAKSDALRSVSTFLLSFSDSTLRQQLGYSHSRAVKNELGSVRMTAPETLPDDVLTSTSRKKVGEEVLEPPQTLFSESMPFLLRRASLGPVGKYAGDVGFDPIGISELFPVEWLREAELKHARVAMLAFPGFIFTDFYHLPGFDYTTLQAHDAAVESGAMTQLLIWIGVLEVLSGISTFQMLRGSGREPGDFNFDPLGFSTDKEKRKQLQAKEIANGRLAMLAFSGIATQAVLTGNSFPYVFGDIGSSFGSDGFHSWLR